MLALAAGLERHSEHGLGHAVVSEAADRGVESLPRAMFARCRDAASSGTLMEERWPQATSL